MERDSKAGDVDLVIFDRAAWALLLADEAPVAYEGLEPEVPADGLYVSEQGQPVYVVNRQEVTEPEPLLEALGDEAIELAKKLGDPITALQQLGRAY